MPNVPRLPKLIMDELEGLPWKLVSGRRHWRLLIDGRQVSVLGANSFRAGDLKTTEITRANIRRFKRRHVLA